MHPPQLSCQPSLQGLPAPQAPAEVVWQAKERKRQRSSSRRRGHSGRGSRQLKTEVIRPDAHRLKHNDNDVLSKRLEQLCLFFLSLSFSFTIVYLANAPIRAPRPEHFLARGARGAPLPLCFVFTLNTLFHMEKTPSYPNRRAVHSFD